MQKMFTFPQINRTQLISALWQIIIILALATIAGLISNGIQKQSIPIVGDFSIQSRMTTETGNSLTIPLADAEKLFNKKTGVFIDARSLDQFNAGHIKGALSLPWHEVDSYINNVLQIIKPTDAIITYCDGDTCNLSHDLALFLQDMGFKNVKVLVNGWSLWEKSGLPVENQG
jgi:rhodanese-related sulfurtransferase